MATQITIDEVVTYAFCPMRYYYTYRAKLTQRQITSTIYYDEIVHKMIYSFFSLLQNHEEPRLNSLKRAWGKDWINKKTSEDVLFISPYSWRESYERLRKQGIQGLIVFWEKFKQEPGFPIAIQKKYQVPINENLILVGTWELIREKDKQFEIIQFRTGLKKITDFMLEQDLKLTASSYAFHYWFKQQEQRLIIYSFDKGTFHITQRQPTEYTILKQTVTQIHQAIESNLFYACPTEKCELCPFKSICRQKNKVGSEK
ncbi:MAG: PD-(D/E)XK nuclease family protein [Turicibacter sp.]|nr:PD-(D/E)XK nuclease family protein [Turicibacter sp.]